MNIPQYVAKSGTVGAVGYGLGMVLQPSTDLVMPGGRRIPFAVFAGGATAFGSMASDVMHDVVLPHILKSERWSNTASAALAGSSAVGSMYGAAAMTDSRLTGEVGLVNLIGLSLAAEAGGSYIFHSFIEPLIYGMKNIILHGY